MTESILSYQQEDSVKLLCEIDLKKLLPAILSKKACFFRLKEIKRKSTFQRIMGSLVFERW